MTSLSRRNVLKRAAKAVGVVVVAFPLAGIASFEALFAPKAELWARWQAHNAGSTASIDHTAWRQFLETYLHADSENLNRFDYAGVTAVDRDTLDRYIAGLADLPIDDYNQDEQRAYWINLYNALTVQVVLAHYPVDSIRDIDISPGLFADGPWGKTVVAVEGEALTLNDIEHRILRPIWRDPRIHYAVNCASVGCPNLQVKPFTGENIDTLLDEAARDYVNSPRGLRLGDKGLIVSSIYAWFQDDFGANDDDVIAHLKRHANPDVLAQLMQAETIADHDYDWSLNDGSNAGSSTDS